MTPLSKLSHVSPSPQGDSLEQVLLVDDSVINLQILHRTLQSSGYKLLIAKDGPAAIEIAKKVSPSLILLDIMMPGMDGYQVCEQLKKDPATAAIAVIFLSALGDSAAKVKGFAVGGVDYISKPFQADEVVARVRNHIKIHRLERQLARRNVELESENLQILNAVREGIVGLNCDGRITMLNPAATRICGWTEADSLGEQLTSLRLFDVDEGESVPEYQVFPYPSYRLGQSVHSDMELMRCRDGHLVPVAITSTPRAEGGAVIVFRDISEWVDSEEALRLAREENESQRQNIAHMERLSTTGEMAAGIAHEVNQPLTAIANYSCVLRRMLEQPEINKAKVVELLDKLGAQSERASAVIQHMRSYVKKPSPGVADIDMNVMIRGVIALAEVDSRMNDVGINFEPQAGLSPVSADLVQVQQVALNLIRNAMESVAARGNHQQDVVVRTMLVGHSVCVEVVDRGVGIAEGEDAQLFHPFYTTKTNGMGIGLSVCQSIVQGQGGEIGFRRNVEGGCTFYFSLPAT